jgi:hypothetical protein
LKLKLLLNNSKIINVQEAPTQKGRKRKQEDSDDDEDEEEEDEDSDDESDESEDAPPPKRQKSKGGAQQRNGKPDGLFILSKEQKAKMGRKNQPPKNRGDGQKTTPTQNGQKDSPKSNVPTGRKLQRNFKKYKTKKTKKGAKK